MWDDVVFDDGVDEIVIFKKMRCLCGFYSHLLVQSTQQNYGCEYLYDGNCNLVESPHGGTRLSSPTFTSSLALACHGLVSILEAERESQRLC